MFFFGIAWIPIVVGFVIGLVSGAVGTAMHYFVAPRDKIAAAVENQDNLLKESQ